MLQKTRILLVEDEEDIAVLIKLQAELLGYVLHVEVDGINGLRTIEREEPDLVIIDVMLPGDNGLDVCRKIKNNPKLSDIPVIILSAKSEEIDICLGLEIGSDDYISKPFSPKILFSKVKALLRRAKSSEPSSQIISFGDFSLDIARYLLKKDDHPVAITLSEFGILKRLLMNRGRVLTRKQLLNDIRNDDAFVIDRNIDVHIAALRKKLGPEFCWIETVRGVGYRIYEEPVPVKNKNV